MVEQAPEPSGCRHCGIPERSTGDNPRYHARQWAEDVGWQGWTQPTQEQIKARMIARRSLKQEGTA